MIVAKHKDRIIAMISCVIISILLTKSIAVDMNTDSYENSTRLALEHIVNANQHSELPCSEIIKQYYELHCFQKSASIAG